MFNIKPNNPILKKQVKAITAVIVMGAFLLADFSRAYSYGPAFAGAFARRHSRPAELRPLAAEEKEENLENEYTGPLRDYLTKFFESMKKSEIDMAVFDIERMSPQSLVSYYVGRECSPVPNLNLRF